MCFFTPVLQKRKEEKIASVGNWTSTLQATLTESIDLAALRHEDTSCVFSPGNGIGVGEVGG